MTTIDFKQIRSSPKSRNDSFEALAVQLFQNTCSFLPSGSTFISLRGDGGDGGVEAYFRTPTAAVFGVQAKYFFKLKESELRHIDDSLQTALVTHPTLSEYWVYIPFDLTGRVQRRRGKSEAERFEEWKNKVETAAAECGTPLTVILCSAATIRDQLLKLDHYAGILRYWFDDKTLTISQIRQCLDEAKEFAGPRYTSEFDLTTNAHTTLDFFGGTGDFRSWREESLIPILNKLYSLKEWGNKTLKVLGEPKEITICTLIDQVITSVKRIDSITAAIPEIANTKNLLPKLLQLLAEVRNVQEQGFYNQHGKEHDTPGFRQFHAEYNSDFPAGEMDAAREREETFRKLQDVLSSQELSAAASHSLLLTGPAGIGKTHAIVSAAFRRLKQGGLSLVVFGDDFDKGEPWEIFRSKLGFGASIDRATLLECLQACAEHTRLPFIIYIDALNESPHNARWKDKLPKLLEQCKTYSGIKICVSTRNTYRNLVVESRFSGFAFEHVGFAGQEFEVLQAFASHYKLGAEITPLFSPELNNPLFLNLACKTLKEKGFNSLDVSLPGFTALFESHLKQCDDLVRNRLQYSNPRNLVKASMILLAETLNNLPQEHTWEKCRVALQNLVGSEITSEDLLKELRHEGLIILSKEKDDTWLVRLSYQRYGDVLRATHLVESAMEPSGLNLAELAKKLKITSVDKEGLLEALAAVLPEKTGVEITVSELGLEPTLAHRVFINALPWRSRKSVTYQIDEHIDRALHTENLWQQVYEVFFRLSLIPRHHLNSENWLGPFLRQSPLANRDAFLSIAAFKSFESNGAVRSLINAALFADINRWPAESRRLAAFSLAWLTSCADRRVRDLSAKGLTRIVAIQPEIGRALTDEFQHCDDDYILESISLAIYSACLLENERRKDFIPALEGLLSPTFDIPNVLVRDSVRLLGILMKEIELPVELKKQLDAFPSKATAPIKWPTRIDAEPLLELEKLPWNMKLLGEHLLPDFWRYQVESRINNFDLQSANITTENIACWLIVETLKLGYPGHENCALHADRSISHEFGTGRGRQVYAERLGKKYYWISLHRLIGVLADNVTPQLSFLDIKRSPKHFWSVDVRKVDLTDVRDINPPVEYPELLEKQAFAFPEQEENIKEWVLQTSDLPSHTACIIRTPSSGEQWVALSFITRNDNNQRFDSHDKSRLYVNLRYTSIFVENKKPPVFNSEAIERDPFDNSETSCYRSYLAEYPNSPIFKQLFEEGDFYEGPNGMTFSEVTLSRSGEWDYDYSYSTPERQNHLRVPCQNLVQLMGLRWDRQRGWVNSAGELIAFEAETKRSRALFIYRSSLNSYLKTTKKKLIYRRFVNRGSLLAGVAGPQIDLKTWLKYHPQHSPSVLKEESL